MWKNVHPVYGTGIRTHDLQNVSLLPLPLDQGSRPIMVLSYSEFINLLESAIGQPLKNSLKKKE